LISTCSACLGYIWRHSDSTLSAAGPPMTLKRTKKAWRAYKLMVMTPLKFVGLDFLSATRQELLLCVGAVFCIMGEAFYPLSLENQKDVMLTIFACAFCCVTSFLN
jgi:hypothetical protein